MIEVIQFTNEAVETKFVPAIQQAYMDAQMLLPKLPEILKVTFTDGASAETGVGGFTETGDHINIAILEDFHDPALQLLNLRGTVLHEAFHVRQGFSFEASPFTALDSAVYEGCAVNFDQDYTPNAVAYADYNGYSDRQMKTWLEEIKQVGTKYFEDRETWHRWAFYHPEHDQKWLIYKIGHWLVDKVLRENAIDVLSLQDKSAQEVLDLM